MDGKRQMERRHRRGLSAHGNPFSKTELGAGSALNAACNAILRSIFLIKSELYLA